MFQHRRLRRSPSPSRTGLPFHWSEAIKILPRENDRSPSYIDLTKGRIDWSLQLISNCGFRQQKFRTSVLLFWNLVSFRLSVFFFLWKLRSSQASWSPVVPPAAHDLHLFLGCSGGLLDTGLLGPTWATRLSLSQSRKPGWAAS